MLAVALTVDLKRGRVGVVRLARKPSQPSLSVLYKADQRDVRNRKKKNFFCFAVISVIAL